MIRSTLCRLFRRPVPPPALPHLEIRAALARLDQDQAAVDAAMRQAFDRRRAALLRGDDAAADRLDREIDALGREQERAELIERRLLDRQAAATEATT